MVPKNNASGHDFKVPGPMAHRLLLLAVYANSGLQMFS